MASISIDSSQYDVKKILDGLSKLDDASLTSFAEEVNRLLAKRKVSVLSNEETTLLMAINKGMDQEMLSRFRTLQEKQHNDNLSAEEEKELIHLVEQIEEKEARRLEHIIALAELWEMSVTELKEKLGINPLPLNVW
jgi:magnesium-transporting ATPase (P-type)